jgi:hypothetical protein
MIFTNALEFTQYVIALSESKGLTVLEVLSKMIEDEEIDVDGVVDMMTPLLKSHLYDNFRALNQLKGADDSVLSIFG